jgi:glyoxylase-like metal-dependent hydrolase (beta-lactamase superfamily II)
MDPADQPISITWRPVRDGVYVTTLEPASVNCGLVVGAEATLLIDTGSSPEQGAALRESISAVTDVPLRHVVLTHDHWDHAYGLAAFADIETIGHESLVASLTSDGVERPVPSTTILIMAARDLGGVHVEIAHFGAGHTQGDLAVLVPGPRVLFTGDLVEEGDPPQVDASTSLKNWSVAMEALLTLCRDDTIVVPGHGEPTEPHYIAWQRAGLAAVYGQCEWLVTQGVAETDAYAHPELQWPWDEEWARAAIHQAYAELAPAGVITRRILPLSAAPKD